MASIGKDRSKVKKDEKREEEVDVEKAKSGSNRMIFLKFQMSSQAAGTTPFIWNDSLLANKFSYLSKTIRNFHTVHYPIW
jgi:hypothetical protein